MTRHAPRVGDVEGPALTPETASEIAGESMEPSASLPETDADDKKGLVVDGCVRLGEDAAALACSVDTAVVLVFSDGADIAGVGGGCDAAGAVVRRGDCVGCVDTAEADDGVAWFTAAAAAAAYLIGGNVGGVGFDGCGGRPAFRMLDMGCCAKFGLGRGRAGRFRRIGMEGQAWGMGWLSYLLQPIVLEYIER